MFQRLEAGLQYLYQQSKPMGGRPQATGSVSALADTKDYSIG